MVANNAAVGNKRKKQEIASGGVLKANSKVDLPLWLAVSLAKRGCCELKTPVYLSEKFMNLVKADPEVVNLRNQSFTLYENVLKLCSHLSEEHIYGYVNQYQAALMERFAKLIIEMADSSEVQQNDQFTADLKRMTNIERELFEIHKR